MKEKIIENNFTDMRTTLEELKKIVQAFVDERDWHQFHSPKNLSMQLSIEANELMEKFLWLTTEQSIEEVDKNRKEIEYELADVFLTTLLLANVMKTDIAKVFIEKLENIRERYPATSHKKITVAEYRANRKK